MSPSRRTEREAKLRVVASEAKRRLEEAGAVLLSPRHLEQNWVLDTPDGRLARSDRLIRLRKAGGGWLLTMKGGAGLSGRHKVREEWETSVEDGEVLLEAFLWSGLEVSWRYEKYRTLFQLGEVRAALDETPLGDFLELEGAEGRTEDAARRLSFDPDRFLPQTYAELWREAGRSGPLLFESGERSR